MKDSKRYVESRQLHKEGYLQENRVELEGSAGVQSISMRRKEEEEVTGKRVLVLIRKFLKSGVMINDVVVDTEAGSGCVFGSSGRKSEQERTLNRITIQLLPDYLGDYFGDIIL